MPHRLNTNLSTPPLIKDLRGLKAASDSYDMDNVYFTEEGWVYRHYKNDTQTRWWDEIISAGQVDVTDADNDEVIATVSAGVKLGTTADAAITFETGDGAKDFEYGDTVANKGGGGGDATVGIDSATISPTDTTATEGDSVEYTVTIAGDASPQIAWAVNGAKISSYPAADPAQSKVAVEFDQVGEATVGVIVGSSDENFDGASETDSITVTVSAAAPPATTIGVVTINGAAGPVDDGDQEVYTADTSNATAGSLTYAWTVSDDASINGASNAASVTIDFAHSSGQASIGLTVSSTDENFDGADATPTKAIVVNPPAPPAADVTLTLTGAEAGNSAYQTDAGNNAAITATIGQIIDIVNNSGGHPVDIVVSDGGAQVSEGTLSNAPAGNGQTLRWDTTGVTAGTYYYQCTSHAAMIGTITISA